MNSHSGIQTQSHVCPSVLLFVYYPFYLFVVVESGGEVDFCLSALLFKRLSAARIYSICPKGTLLKDSVHALISLTDFLASFVLPMCRGRNVINLSISLRSLSKFSGICFTILDLISGFLLCYFPYLHLTFTC